MSLLFVFEILGTIAFAISGSMGAIRKKMDIFGVVILGMTTAVGGGILRDLILGITPPNAFSKPIYAFTAIAVSLIAFIPRIRTYFLSKKRIYTKLMTIIDAIGLGVFTVVGVQVAFLTYPELNAFLYIFVGVITGVGGGILRDLFTGDTPYVFREDIYACASLVGALACIFAWIAFGDDFGMFMGATVTIVVRLLAVKYQWRLPIANYRTSLE